MGLKTIEEIALVFAGVDAFEQQRTGFGLGAAGVVAGGQGLCPQRDGVIQKSFKFDFGVTQHVRVGGAACGVFLQKIVEHAVFVLAGKVDHFHVDAEHIGDCHRIQRVLLNRAIVVGIVVFPVLHKDTNHLVPFLFQQMGGDGGIYAARQADDDALFFFSHLGGSIH